MAGENSEFQTSALHFVSAFLAMEPTDTLMSFARLCGEGSITESVQRFIWDQCLREAAGTCHAPYLKRFLKKLIGEVESNHDDVLDEIYELLTDCLTFSKEENVKTLRYISFLFPDGCYNLKSHLLTRKLVVPLHCSLNMLEGDTGCSIWPSSLFLSEFILSNPPIFSNKSCFEVGSGVGLVGICLAHVKASRAILSDGDLSTLANMKHNLKLSHLNHDDDDNQHVPDAISSTNSVKCLHLPWESAAESELLDLDPDIILGADVIYDPMCLPHLVRVLSILLRQREHRVAYIASVIRNAETFNYFLALAGEARIAIKDMTETHQPFDLLPYMQSYNRSSIRLFTLTAE